MAEELKIQISAPNIQSMTIVIKGTAPLICHRWSEKAKQMIIDKQAKKANKGREIRNPEQEIEDSYYKNEKKEICFPAICIKQAMVGAARSLKGVPMTVIRAAVFIDGDKDGLLPVAYKEKRGRADMVRIGMGVADIRYRGELIDWQMKLPVRFNADVLSAEQVANLLQTAGFSCGIGEWRPERNGNYGTFEIDNT